MKKLFFILFAVLGLLLDKVGAAPAPILRDDATTNPPAFFRKLDSKLGGYTFTGTNFLSGTNLNGFLKEFRWTAAAAGGRSLILSNVVLRDVILSNSATAADHALLSCTNYPTALVFDAVTVKARERAAFFKSDIIADDVWRLTARDCIFEGGTYAFEAWNAFGFFSGCSFNSLGTGSDSVAILANDDSHFSIENSRIDYGGGSAASYGYFGMQNSKTVFRNCLFESRTGTNLPNAVLGIGEANISLVLENCWFNTRTNPVLVFEDGGIQRDDVYVEFKNCWVGDYPANNPKIFYNSNYVVHVTGGNLVEGMFSAPSNVVWALRWNIATNALAVDVSYTNGPAAVRSDVSFMVTTTLPGDVGQMDLLLDQDGNGTWEQTLTRLLYSAASDLNGTLDFGFYLQPGARYRFGTTNATGSSFEFISRQEVLK